MPAIGRMACQRQRFHVIEGLLDGAADVPQLDLAHSSVSISSPPVGIVINSRLGGGVASLRIADLTCASGADRCRPPVDDRALPDAGRPPAARTLPEACVERHVLHPVARQRSDACTGAFARHRRPPRPTSRGTSSQSRLGQQHDRAGATFPGQQQDSAPRAAPEVAVERGDYEHHAMWRRPPARP